MSIQHKSEELFSKLKDKKENKEACSICLLKFDNDEVELECDHYFHITCLFNWYRRNNTCPICRKKINIKKFPIKTKVNKIISYLENKIDILIPILLLISLFILIASLIPWSKTSFALKIIFKKLYYIGYKIVINIMNIIRLLLRIIIMLIKGLFYGVMKTFINLVLILYSAVKIIYYIISLVLTIILSIFILASNIVVDCLNFIIFIVENIFKLI